LFGYRFTSVASARVTDADGASGEVETGAKSEDPRGHLQKDDPTKQTPAERVALGEQKNLENRVA
jgi:hypothetical protein